MNIIILPVIFLFPVATAVGLLLVAAALAGVSAGSSEAPAFEEDNDEFEASKAARRGSEE
ncbi:MAG: hypothetical protein H0X71_09485 [Rubrobacter sp.]|nr:hypothetical protein [Rubrobacter sp.]